MTTKSAGGLPLQGEKNGDQVDLAGRIYKRAISPLLIERASQYAEALDAQDSAKEESEHRKDALEGVFKKQKEKDQFIDISTMAGNTYRFHLESTEKVVKQVARAEK